MFNKLNFSNSTTLYITKKEFDKEQAFPIFCRARSKNIKKEWRKYTYLIEIVT